MLDQETVQLNRQLALNALELNQGAYKQIQGNLTNGQGGRCALGLMAEGVHMPPDVVGADKVYHYVENALGMTPAEVAVIYRKNDNEHLSFRAIAKWLRERWGM